MVMLGTPGPVCQVPECGRVAVYMVELAGATVHLCDLHGETPVALWATMERTA